MNKTKQPLVSVIMPVFNAGKFLGEAIDSVLDQTYSNFEFLIVDDKSTDCSRKIIRRYQKRFPKLIKTFFLKKNINAAGNGAVNAVLPKAEGRYIARMDADDVAHPRRLEKQVEFLEKNKDIILAGTWALVINGKGDIIGKKVFPLTHGGIYKKYAIVHPIIHPSCMIRRSLLPDRDRLYELKGGVNDDYYSFFRLLQHGRFANLPDFLLKYRIHKGNTSLKNLKQKYSMVSQIRKVAVKKFNYKISIKNKGVVLLQDLIVGVTPEKWIKKLYFLALGLRKNVNFSI